MDFDKFDEKEKEAVFGLANVDVATATTIPKGVCFDSTKGKYKAYVNMFGVRTWLGSFSSMDDAISRRNDFVSAIVSSRYPLVTFIRDRFNVSFNKALVFIASALKAYVQRVDVEKGLVLGSGSDSGFMFPSFAVAFVAGCGRGGSLVSVGSARSLLSLQDPITDIIFGKTSISKFRLDHHCQYQDVFNSLLSVANGLA
jgi:hypothetical protein